MTKLDKFLAQNARSLTHNIYDELICDNTDSFARGLYRIGARVTHILWWEYLPEEGGDYSISMGGPRDPDNPGYYWGETVFDKDIPAEWTAEDVLGYISEMRKEHPGHRLVPGFDVRDRRNRDGIEFIQSRTNAVAVAALFVIALIGAAVGIVSIAEYIGDFGWNCGAGVFAVCMLIMPVLMGMIAVVMLRHSCRKIRLTKEGVEYGYRKKTFVPWSEVSCCGKCNLRDPAKISKTAERGIREDIIFIASGELSLSDLYTFGAEAILEMTCGGSDRRYAEQTAMRLHHRLPRTLPDKIIWFDYRDSTGDFIRSRTDTWIGELRS